MHHSFATLDPFQMDDYFTSTSCQVNEFLAGAGTDAPDVDEENIISRPSVSYDDLWAKTLLETSELEVCVPD